MTPFQICKKQTKTFFVKYYLNMTMPLYKYEKNIPLCWAQKELHKVVEMAMFLA